MKKLVIIILLSATFIFADVTIPAGNVSGTWTQANSPYFIDGEIIIQLSDNLTIQPGVDVIFNGHYKFIINGKLLAQGTPADSILFTVADTTGFSNVYSTDGGWHGLRFMSCIYNGQGNSKLEHCRIEYAKSSGYGAPYADRRGGGIYINLSSNLEITNCEISNNMANYASGIYCWESSPILSGLTIKNNFALHDGGGIIFSGENTNPTLENSIISGNSCYYDGGGIYCCSGSAPVISNVTITGNSCINWEGAAGGGISCRGANPVLISVVISDNYSIGNGGGISCSYNSSLSVIDGIINRNISDWSGGGIWISNSTINISGVTISGNVTSGNGGGIYFGNDAEIVFDPDNRCNIYCNTDINNNIGNDLHANNLTDVDVIVDTFTVILPTDYYVYPIENFTFDILSGKIEPVNADMYVSPEGSNANSGLTPDEPLRNIYFALQMIIADEMNPVSIFLANGIYSPSQTQELFPIFTKDYVDIIGENRENTILDAEETNRVVYALEATHSIKNLTVKSGKHHTYGNGGGFYVNESDIELENLLITANRSNNYGGGIYCNDSDILLNNVIITENNTSGYYSAGGGIYFDYSNPILNAVTITNNYAGCGGGLCIQYSNVIFDSENRCNIYGNSAGMNYGDDFFLNYDDTINVFVDTFTVHYPTTTQVNYPGHCTFDIQNSIISPIDADLFVSPTGSDENSGLSPDDPFLTISFAINSISSNANNPRSIYLDEGIYSLSISDEQLPLAGKDHVRIIGENPQTTIIDGENSIRHFLIYNAQDFSIENIKLMNGDDNRYYYFQDDDGGAIRTFNSDIYLNNMIFSDNNAYWGGAVYNYGSDVEICNSLFFNNSAQNYGTIHGSQSNVRLDKTCFYNNYSSYSAGGVYATYDSHFIISNCTFFENEGGNDSGAIYSRGSDTEIINTICWNNSPEELRITSSNNHASSLTVINSDITGGESGINQYGNYNTINWLDGNIDEDPLFTDPTNGDFNLTENSPCVDAGTAYFEWNGEVILDLEEDEYNGNAPDMGAFESDFTSSEIPEIPIVFSLKQNYPNPFNPDTNILYSLPVDCNVNISIYNIKGQKVKTLVREKQEKGHHSIVWNGKDNHGKIVSSGIYFYKIKAKNNGKNKFTKVHKMMMLK